jgi:hypothetical protein
VVVVAASAAARAVVAVVDSRAYRVAAEVAAACDAQAWAVDPSGRRSGRTAAEPARKAGRSCSFLQLFARMDRVFRFVVMGEGGVERVGAIQVGAVGLTAEAMPQPAAREGDEDRTHR